MLSVDMGQIKKVVVLHGSSGLYGADRSILRSMLALKSKGITSIFILSKEGPLVDLARENGIEVRINRLGVIRRKYLNPKGLFGRFVSMRQAYSSLKKILEEEKIDLIYTNTTLIWVGAMLSWRTGIRHIWHVREIIHKPVLLKWIIGNLMKLGATRVICVSKAVRTSWNRFGPKNRMIVLYNGIETTTYNNLRSELKTELGVTSSTLVIGMIGRVNLLKGQSYFLEIARHLMTQRSDLHFVLVGDPFPGYEYLLDELKEQVLSNGMTEAVTDLGFRTDIPNILAGLDIFVLPSIGPDSLPTVVLEAMAASKPVVATKTGGSVEMVVEGETGILIPHDDSEQAAEMILTQLLNSSDLQATGNKGRERVEQFFSYETFERNFVEMIGSLGSGTTNTRERP